MKKYSLKFWIVFWGLATVFLIGWFFYCQIKFNENFALKSAIDLAPVSQEKKEEVKLLGSLVKKFLTKDSEEKSFLILFQNNMELRPGGGFIGSFGILKIKDRKILSFETHDTANFDGRIPDIQEPPYPMKETLHIKSWQLRDSNYSPDFPTNAKKALEFYYLGGGQEKFDGVFAITADVLGSILEITGPIQLKDYPGTYDSENAAISLEYQVEKGYTDQEIQKGERKSVMKELGQEIIKKLYDLNNTEKIKLAGKIIESLNKKDIQLYFSDTQIQQEVEKIGWAGKMDTSRKGDYLMLVDANLGAYKSDYYIKRQIDYAVDLSGENPQAILKITYIHTAKQKDWMTKDYLTYLRVYVPQGSWLAEWKNLPDPRFGKELEKKYFGFLVNVPLNQSKTVELRYDLPKELAEDYQLLIQKQAGTKNTPAKIKLKFTDEREKNLEEVLNKDLVF